MRPEMLAEPRRRHAPLHPGSNKDEIRAGRQDEDALDSAPGMKTATGRRYWEPYLLRVQTRGTHQQGISKARPARSRPQERHARYEIVADAREPVSCRLR